MKTSNRKKLDEETETIINKIDSEITYLKQMAEKKIPYLEILEDVMDNLGFHVRDRQSVVVHFGRVMTEWVKENGNQ